MLRALVDGRRIVALAVAGAVGIWGLSAYPFVADNAFLGLIDVRAPRVFALLRYGYRNQESMAVVQYPLRFLDGLWLPVPPNRSSTLVSSKSIRLFRMLNRASLA